GRARDWTGGRLPTHRRRRPAPAPGRQSCRLRRLVDRRGGQGVPECDLVGDTRRLDTPAEADGGPDARLVSALVARRVQTWLHLEPRRGEIPLADLRPAGRGWRGAEAHRPEGGCR